MASPGKIDSYGLQAGGATTAKLYNFDINSFNLKSDHLHWLDSVVVPLLRSGGSLVIVGLASRTGTHASNTTLSEKRSRAVIDFLRKQVPNNFNVRAQASIGETAAMFAGVKDGIEHEKWRAVVISVWGKPAPPPPPPPPPPPVQPDFKATKRWLGFGVKSGGQLGIGGYESTTASLMNLYDYETFDLLISNSRWGLGLGGSGGFVAVIGFGFSIPNELHGKSVKDWGFEAAYTHRLVPKSMVRVIQHSKPFIDAWLKGGTAGRIYRAQRNVKKSLELIANIRDSLHTLYAGLEVAEGKGVIVLDLPLLGGGLELSGFITRGTMYVSNPSHWSGSDY